MERNYAKLKVTPKAERALRQGHPWVYGEEITSSEGSWTNGDIVDVLSPKGRWLGSGFVNDHSKIRVRLLSRAARSAHQHCRRRHEGHDRRI